MYLTWLTGGVGDRDRRTEVTEREISVCRDPVLRGDRHLAADPSLLVDIHGPAYGRPLGEARGERVSGADPALAGGGSLVAHHVRGLQHLREPSRADRLIGDEAAGAIRWPPGRGWALSQGLPMAWSLIREISTTYTYFPINGPARAPYAAYELLLPDNRSEALLDAIAIIRARWIEDLSTSTEELFRLSPRDLELLAAALYANSATPPASRLRRMTADATRRRGGRRRSCRRDGSVGGEPC